MTSPIEIIIDPVRINYIAWGTVGMGINFSWRQGPQGLAGAALRFSLRFSSGSSFQETLMLHNESTYHFTAPEGAPPCDVYNFSVTATYVGATYTGAGCSVPSPVLRFCLPSLPDIQRMESSLMYSLVHQSEQFVLNISFEVS